MNIPSRDEWAWMIRQIFVPNEPGWLFTAMDYSQIEMRLQALFSQDEVLLEAFHTGADIHKRVASRIYGIPEDQITKRQRYTAKRAVYLESYGGGWVTLQRKLAVEGVYLTPAETKAVLSGIASGLPERNRWKERTLKLAQRQQYLRNPFGRVRRFYGPVYGDAFNFLPQSTAADVILDAMIRLQEELPKPARLVAQVHDDLLTEHPPEMTKEVQECLRDVMEAPIAAMKGWSCPVDGKTGKDWSFRE
jgi:DNA polymerase-1